MRSLIDVAYTINESAYDDARETMEVLDEAEKAVYSIGNASPRINSLPSAIKFMRLGSH